MLIVVDGGASHCRAAAFEACGVRCAEVRIESHASLSLGIESAAATVSQAIAACAQRLDQPRGWLPDRVVLGLAGSLGAARRAAFLAQLDLAGRVDVITDGQAQLLGATGGRAGVCAAVGTGSVVHWRDARGAFGMGGGWGFPVGDEGSAAWLGVEALRAWVGARDRQTARDASAGESAGALFDALRNRIGDDIGDVQRWTTCTVSSELGRLAPLVSAAAESGDSAALAIRERGAEACAALLALAPAGLPRWLTGGLAEVYRPVLEGQGHRLEALAGDALDGLYRFAQSEQAPSGPGENPRP